MDIADADKAIVKHFTDGWGNLAPVAFDDVKFDIPQATWARLNIRHNLGNQTTMGDPGNNRHEQQGVVTVQIFEPQGNHGIDARVKAQAAASLFRGKSAQGIHFFETTYREIGNDGAGFFQINVTARFRYDLFA
ncbi:MAG: hypothetical protein DI551_05685 [Micavibrio aeruginosavorus]|uniref:Uncharacterized protein n=1 Tax=Micavibrio aeruginosavorus TaxID=349221 RepID=A0A2W5Q480_9BACT|nr:MAG: hypothetical protein DI551_05685 [Micavibrio aeruginosavorus]